MHGQLNSEEFDYASFESSLKSPDRTVVIITRLLWSFYDDCFVHEVSLAKSEWDFWQRLLLVLESEGHLGERVSFSFGLPEALAWTAMVLILSSAVAVGWPWGLLLLAPPFGFFSVAIQRLREQRLAQSDAEQEQRLRPYRSLAELRNAKRSAPAFRKKRYPGGDLGQPMHGSIAGLRVDWLKYPIWLALSPAVLLWQCLPQGRYRCWVREPA